MRIKHSGQMAMPTNPKHGAADYHAQLAKLAVCNCGANTLRTTVLPYPVAVATKKRRRVGVPATV